MEMDAKVVQSQVNAFNDEHPPHLNIDSQQDAVSPGTEEQNSDHDSKSSVFMNKVKAKAKKIRNTFKNIGHQQEEPATIYDTEAIKSTATPTEKEKVKDLVVSEVDYEGTKEKGDGEDLHHRDHDQLGEGLSSTNEINQNIATEKPRVLEKDLQEQGSRPETYNHPNYQNEVTNPSGLDYDSEDVKRGALVSEKVEDLKKPEIDENTPTEKQRLLEKDPYEQGSRPEAYNLPNHQTKVTDPSGLDYDSEDVKRGAPVSEKLEDLKKPEIDENTATEKQRLLEKDPYEKGSRPEAYNLPNHQTKVTDPRGSDEINGNTIVEESFEKLNVQDEPKPIIEPKTQPTIADTEYPSARSYDQFKPQTKTQHESAKEETFDNITDTVEKQPYYESVETQPKHKNETENLSATASETFSPENDEAYEDKVKETHDDYEKVMTELKEEVPKTSTGGDIGTGTKNESVETQPKDKDEINILSGTATETFSPKKDEAYEDKVKETHDDYEKVMSELKEEVPETSTGDGIGTETKNESAETQPKHKEEIKILSENNEASDEKGDRNEEEKVKETHDDYEKVMVELKEEVPEAETSIGDDIGTETKNEDKDNHDKGVPVKDYLAENLRPGEDDDDIGTETKNEDKDDHDKGVPVKDYLAEKVRPGEDDKALSEVIPETLHKKKEEPVKKEDGEEKSEKVGEETSVESPGKGMVGRLKGAVGSWFYTPEEKQSPQVAGDGDLSKNKDSVVEGERVGQVKNE